MWMDVTNEDSVVPLCDERILSKVLRLNWAEVSKNPGPVPVNGNVAKAPAPVPPLREPKPQEDMINFGRQTSESKDMINFGEFPGQTGSKPRAAPSNDFDMLFG